MATAMDDIITLDPAEVFEFTAAEYAAQVYDRLVTFPVDDVTQLTGHIAESWTIADDGKTYTFKIRDDVAFHSGNPLTAHDAAFSLQRDSSNVRSTSGSGRRMLRMRLLAAARLSDSGSLLKAATACRRR